MKKLLPVLLILVIAGGLWFAISSRSESSAPPRDASNNASQRDSAHSAFRSNMIKDLNNGGHRPDGGADAADDSEGVENFDERSAVERYKSAEEALKAIKDGAVDYDDLVLDQFTNLGENCTWCDAFYKQVKDLALSPETKSDQRSYFAEVLAISGRVENVKSLVDAIKNAANPEEAQMFAEALELTVGKDDVVKYLGEQLGQGNDQLREASVAAITNQGTRVSVELLHDHTVQRGDPDGYYSSGIGLGEVVPEPEAYPYLQEQLLKRDQYSNLAVKALLNSGLDGLKIVMDTLSNSNNQDFDKEMLKGAKDHVTFDDDVVKYLRQVAETSNNPTVRQFANDSLKDFDQMENEAKQESEGGKSAPFTSMTPPPA